MEILNRLMGHTANKFKIGDVVYLKERLGFSQKDPTGGEWKVTDVTRAGYIIHRGCKTVLGPIFDGDLVSVEKYQNSARRVN